MIFLIGTENTPCDISNELSFITDKKSHTKTKIGGHLCPRGSKYAFKLQKWFWNHIFYPWGHKWPPSFVFVCDFQSSMKDKAIDISQGVFSAPIWKIEFFLPHFTVLPVFTKYRTAPKRAVEEKNWTVFQFWYEKFHFFQCSFSFFEV